MKEVIRHIYISADGVEFVNPEECLSYEKRNCPVFPHIYLFDGTQKPIPAYKNADMFFILIKRDCPDAELEQFKEYAYNDVSYFTKGTIFAYDRNNNYYVDIGALYHKIEDITNLLWEQVYRQE